MNDKKALIALMDLVLAIADYATTPPGHRSEAVERVRVKRQALALGDADEVPPLTEDYWNRAVVMRAGVQERATRLRQELAVSQNGAAARAAVAATERRYDRMWGLEPIEADDNRLTQPFSVTHKARLARDSEYAAAWAAEYAADDSRITDGHKQAPCGDGWCTCGMCASQQASEHKPYGGKPGCGCSVCQCARSVGG